MLESHAGSLTVLTQFNTPLQSPVPHAAGLPFPLLVPSALKLQFVLPQTLPCQSFETVRVRPDPGSSLNPLLEGPLPACVPIPGHIVSLQELRIRSSDVPLLEPPLSEELLLWRGQTR